MHFAATALPQYFLKHLARHSAKGYAFTCNHHPRYYISIKRLAQTNLSVYMHFAAPTQSFLPNLLACHPTSKSMHSYAFQSARALKYFYLILSAFTPIPVTVF
jgi:hypothetical protein